MCDYEESRMDGTWKPGMEASSVKALQELRVWIEIHKDIFAGRTPEEIADRAILVGFDRSVVNMWLTAERFRRAI